MAPQLAFLGLVVYFLSASPFARTDFPLDDAWIHRVYSHSVATGEAFAYNTGQQEAGSTSPLWTIVTAPPHWLSGLGANAVTLTVKIFGIVIGMVALFFVQRLAFLLSGSATVASITAILFLTDARFVFSALSGMENILLLALLMGGTYAMLASRWRAASLSFGLSLVTRPEAVLVLPAYFVCLLFRARRHAEARSPLVWFVPLVPMAIWSAFCAVVTGHPLPNTFYLKARSLHAGFGELQSAWNILTQHGPSSSFLAVVGLVAVVLWACVQRGTRRGGALFLVLLPIAYAWAVAGTRYVTPDGYYWTRWIDPGSLILSFAICLGLALLAGMTGDRRMQRRLPRIARDHRRLAKAITAIAFLCIGLASPALLRSIEDRRFHLWSDARAVHLINVAAGEWIDRYAPPESSVCVYDAGAIRYFGKRHTIDLIGLNSADIAFGRVDVSRVVDGCDWLAIFPGKLEQAVRAESFDERLAISIPLQEYTICDCPEQTSIVILERRQHGTAG